MSSIFRRINKEFLAQINCDRDLPSKDELITLINLLNPEERAIVVKIFLNYEWNIGSIRILSILQSCNTLSATQYILKQNDEKHIQLILNDFLEAEFILLANLIETFYYSSTNTNSLKLKSYLEDCFRQLVYDSIENPNVVNLEYLQELRKLLSEKVYLKVIHMHLQSLFKIDSTNCGDCFTQLRIWKETAQNNPVFMKLLNELIVNQEFVIEESFKLLSSLNFKGWKYFSILLGIIGEKSSKDSTLLIKKHLKDIFTKFVNKNDKELCYVMFFIARSAYNTATDCTDHSNTETYNSWFKNTIGSMKYTINANSFKYVMSVLTEMINMEKDPVYIQIHINTAINPPTRCNDIVLNYKSLCKKHLQSLLSRNKVQNNNFDEEESIIIDDD